MKLVKMSLAAAMLMGVSAYALDDVKVSGEAKLWYQTHDMDVFANGGEDLFDRKTSMGDASLKVGVSGKAGSAVAFNVEVTALDTMGLENNLVANVAATGSVDTQWWASQANVIVTLGKTTAVLGRQALDTPLAFTEKWNVVENTFDAAVLVNGDLPNTTLVGAYVGKENSSLNTLVGNATVNTDGHFQSYASNVGAAYELSGVGGAYAVGAVFAGIPDVTVQGWYYNVLELADAFWLQADAKVAGIDLGAQYASVDLDPIGLDATSAYAFKVGYSVAGVNLGASYSDVSDDNVATGVGVNNVTTQNQTKLYTGAGLNGMLLAQGTAATHLLVNPAAPDTTAWSIGASTAAAGATLLAEYTSTESDTYGDKSAWAVAAVTNVVGIDLLAGVTGGDLDAAGDVTAVRVTAGLKF